MGSDGMDETMKACPGPERRTREENILECESFLNGMSGGIAGREEELKDVRKGRYVYHIWDLQRGVEFQVS